MSFFQFFHSKHFETEKKKKNQPYFGIIPVPVFSSIVYKFFQMGIFGVHRSPVSGFFYFEGATMLWKGEIGMYTVHSSKNMYFQIWTTFENERSHFRKKKRSNVALKWLTKWVPKFHLYYQIFRTFLNYTQKRVFFHIRMHALPFFVHSRMQRLLKWLAQHIPQSCRNFVEHWVSFVFNGSTAFILLLIWK